jgi:sugar phosphate isomerase/epimerase
MTAPFSWPLAAFLPSLPLDFANAVARAAAIGFRHVDPVALVDRPPEHLDALAEAGVLIGCAAVGRDLPPEHSLDAADVERRRATVRLMKRQLDDAARLGATCAYIVPGADAGARFADAVTLLADHASRQRVRLCVEAIPGRALDRADATLAWLRRLGHANLFLLLDVGHCLITNEDAATVIRDAGSLLGYVHLDDNDGVSDQHWPLLTGKLTLDDLCRVQIALQEMAYRGGIALELNASHPNPEAALAQGRAIIQQAFLPQGS